MGESKHTPGPWSHVLDWLWGKVNALGGYQSADDKQALGINETVGHVLGMIEALGGMDPLSRKGDGPTPCPRCAGTGLIGPVHINRGDQPHEWIDQMTCDLCNGRGTIDAGQRKAIELGKQLRDKRVARLESLGVCARRLGLKPSELSALETGRYGLASWAHPFATAACGEIDYWPEKDTAIAKATSTKDAG